MIHGKLFQKKPNMVILRERRVKHIIGEAEKMLMDNRLCITCGGRVPQGRTKYCREDCYRILYRQRKRIEKWKAQGFTVIKGQLKLCSHCKEPIPKERDKSAEYCSHKCCVDVQIVKKLDRYHKGKEKKLCIECGEKPLGPSRKYYCGEKCADRAYKKNQHPFALRMRAYLGKEFRKVRKDGTRRLGALRHVGYTIPELEEFWLERDWPDGFPDDYLDGRKWHIHHIKPLNRFKLEGKLETEEDVVKAFAMENLKLVTAYENLSISNEAKVL